jgi:hypothetical protein
MFMTKKLKIKELKSPVGPCRYLGTCVKHICNVWKERG